MAELILRDAGFSKKEIDNMSQIRMLGNIYLKEGYEDLKAKRNAVEIGKIVGAILGG